MIAVRVLEDRELTPGLLFRPFDKFHPALFELAVGSLHIVARERAVEERTNSIFVPLGRKQNDARRGVGDPHFDPALLVVELLVGGDLEPELFGIEPQGPILVGGGDSDELQLGNHTELLPTATRTIRATGCPL